MLTTNFPIRSINRIQSQWFDPRSGRVDDLAGTCFPSWAWFFAPAGVPFFFSFILEVVKESRCKNMAHECIGFLTCLGCYFFSHVALCVTHPTYPGTHSIVQPQRKSALHLVFDKLIMSHSLHVYHREWLRRPSTPTPLIRDCCHCSVAYQDTNPLEQ